LKGVLLAKLNFEQSMAIRITKEVESEIAILHIDGQLRSKDIGALNSEYLDLTGPVALELSQLQSADAAGVAALLEIASLGAELRGVSGYVKLLLSRRGNDHLDT
jgi:ABC-type transporter Mla MlaB component